MRPRMWRRLITLALILGAMVAAWVAIGSPGVHHQSSAPSQECSATVIDTTPEHILKGASDVRAAARSLEQEGVNVRVRVLENMPTSGYSAYLSGVATNCPDWLGPVTVSHGHKAYGLGGRMLVVMLARGQTAGVSWGDKLGPGVGPALGPALSDMNVQFAHGAYSAGLAVLLRDLEPAITPAPPVTQQAPGHHTGGVDPGELGGLVAALLALAGWQIWRSTGKRGARRKARRRLERAKEAIDRATPNASGLTAGLTGAVNARLMLGWSIIRGRYTGATIRLNKLGRKGTTAEYLQLSDEAGEIIREAKEFLDYSIRPALDRDRQARIPPPRSQPLALPPGQDSP